MLEPRRSQYLHALGVDVYVPRVVLPYAAVSPACEWDYSALAEPAIISDNSAAAAAVANPAPASASVAASRQAPVIDATPPVRRTAPEPLQVAEISTGYPAIPRFSLSIIPADTGVLIVDDAPPANAARADYLKLLGNLLFALQPKTANVALEVFAWPMVRNAQIDQSASAAREAVGAYLQKHIDQRGAHTVLLLGAAASQWVLPTVAQGRRRAASSVSLWACLRDPRHKRQLWQDLRHLAAQPA